ncbi:unnamed protein product [Coccothraustes coccothraustes]
MDLEVKGVAASPRRKAELSLRGKKYQDWRSYRQATHSPRPPEVPCLDLGRLGDSDEEKTRPENLPYLRDRSKSKHGQYEACTREEYKQHPQRIAEKKIHHLHCPDTSIKVAGKGTQLEDGQDFVTLDKKALLQQCCTNKPCNMQHNIRKSEAEDVAAERRNQAVVEQVMVDQLCRAFISDPEQSTHSDVCKEAQGLLGAGMAPMHFRKRTLHETKIKTKSGLTENMLSNKLCFDSRIISRTNALPFIQKGVYHHQRGRRREKAYDLSDFYVGANLTFRSVDHNLPESVKQNPFFTLLILNVILSININLDFFRASSVELNEECSRQVVDDSEVFKKIQGTFRETLSKRGVWVITGLGKYFRQIDKNRNGFLSQAALKEALKLFHLEMPEEDFEALWLILDDSKNDKVDYGEFTHAIFGEMNEYRKTFVRKAYMKLDFSKTGSVPMVDVRKCYYAKKHPLVLAGKTAEEEIKSSFVEALGESCSDPNEVSYSEFEDYYEGLSFGIVGDDDFVNILRNSWGI